MGHAKDLDSSTISRPRFRLRFREYLDPEKKKFYNEQLFTAVAPRYDLITRGLSLGRDAAWKRRLVAGLPDCRSPFCVDLACGTGDVSLLLAEKYPAGMVLGLDLTQSMLEIAANRDLPSNLRFDRRDMCATELQADSADIVTGSYALRNAPALEPALKEIHRILRPGGVAAFLDFSKPANKTAQFFEYWVLRTWGSLWGLVLHGNPEVYAYIAESLRLFPDRLGLRRAIADAGFEVLHAQRFYMGVMEILWFQKL